MQQEHLSSPFKRRALLIINPVSGKRMVLRYIPQIIRIFMDAGYLVTTVVTSRRGDAVDYAHDLGGGFDLICCTGGDGTLNETITGLARGDIHVPIGYIPCGSTNDFAVSRALSTDILTAARQAASGKKSRQDSATIRHRSKASAGRMPLSNRAQRSSCRTDTDLIRTN